MLPAWSADGRWLYFCSDRSGRRQIWKMAADGGPAVQVTRNGGLESYETPDGEYLYFTRDYFEAGIWQTPVRGGEEKPVRELARAGYWRSWDVSRSGGVLFRRAGKGRDAPSCRELPVRHEAHLHVVLDRRSASAVSGRAGGVRGRRCGGGFEDRSRGERYRDGRVCTVAPRCQRRWSSRRISCCCSLAAGEPDPLRPVVREARSNAVEPLRLRTAGSAP